MPERLWQNLSVRLAVALAFADASIVVLALPQIVDRLHTSISHVVWVIVAYNLALIVGSIAVIPFAKRLPARPTLIAGLALFGLASIGCGASGSLSSLVPFRVAQGFGGALIVCASLPLFAGSARPGDSPLYGWSAAAAIGAAVGPAAGGVLTQIFSWRSIFFAQAPVAAVAAIAVLALRPAPVTEDQTAPERPALDPLSANIGLTLLSAGLIGALFLVVVELINAWLVTPIGAAAIVTTIPITTAIAERALRGNSPLVLGVVGALLVALGLGVLALVTHQDIALVVLALALCGTGLGLGFPGLTSAALAIRGSATAAAARTVAARDAGLVLGLLVLTPVFVDQLNAAQTRATNEATPVVAFAPLPLRTRFALGTQLASAVNAAPVSRPPDIRPVFARFEASAAPSQRAVLQALERRLNTIIQRAATHTFKRPYLYGSLFALLVVPLLWFRARYLARRAQRASARPLS